MGRLFHLITHPTFFTLIFLVLAVILTIVIFLLRKSLILKRLLDQKTVLLEITPPAFTDKTALNTQNFFSVIHGLGKDRNLKNRLLGNKTIFSLEIVSTLNHGIRFLMRSPNEEANVIKKIGFHICLNQK